MQFTNLKQEKWKIHILKWQYFYLTRMTGIGILKIYFIKHLQIHFNAKCIFFYQTWWSEYMVCYMDWRTKCRKNRQNFNKNSTVGYCFLQRGHATPVTHDLVPLLEYLLLRRTFTSIICYYSVLWTRITTQLIKILSVYYSSSRISSESKLKWKQSYFFRLVDKSMHLVSW